MNTKSQGRAASGPGQGSEMLMLLSRLALMLCVLAVVSGVGFVAVAQKSDPPADSEYRKRVTDCQRARSRSSPDAERLCEGVWKLTEADRRNRPVEPTDGQKQAELNNCLARCNFPATSWDPADVAHANSMNAICRSGCYR